MKRILILYRELAGYFVECVNYLSRQHNVAIDIIAYPVNPDAPFNFIFAPEVSVFRRNDFDLKGLLAKSSEHNYDMIFCGGWGDKDYLKVVSKSGCKVKLLGFDNQWSGSIKQRLAAVYGRKRITPLFDVAFVPGPGQVSFAKHIGFKPSQIVTGAYSCDVNKFGALAKSSSESMKKLYFVGRYAPEKFIVELLETMASILDENNYNWELQCAGIGPLWEARMEHSGIVHKGFMQPDELFKWMENGDAFILPSTFEPWGVAVHEFAAAGYPLLLSDCVGARHAFLEDGKNGFLFKCGDKADLKKKLILLFSLETSQLKEMGEQSRQFSFKITQQTWAASLYDLIK